MGYNDVRRVSKSKRQELLLLRFPDFCKLQIHAACVDVFDFVTVSLLYLNGSLSQLLFCFVW